MLIEKGSFELAGDRSLNALNVPCHNHQHQLQAKELVAQANVLIKDLVNGFSDFYAYSEERSRLFLAGHEPLSDINKKVHHLTILREIVYMCLVIVEVETFHLLWWSNRFASHLFHCSFDFGNFAPFHFFLMVKSLSLV